MMARDSSIIRRARRAGAGTVVAMLCAHCAPGRIPATTTADRPVDRGTVLDARLLQMLDMRLADTTIVDAVLRDASSARRGRGALAVGQMKMRSRYAWVRLLLVDADTAVSANAAYALGIAKDTGSVSALARALAGAPDVVAREAAWALGEIGEPARVVLTVALGEGMSQPLTMSAAGQRRSAVRAALLLASVKLAPVPVATVLPWLADSASEPVRAAAYVLGRNRLPAGVRALLSVRSHPDDETRQHVARGLAKSAAGDSMALTARAALTVLIGDASARVRMNAARSIASYGPVALRDVERALADADANVRVAASEGMGAVLLRDSAGWRRTWDRDTTFRVRQQLLSAARASGVTALAAFELEWSRHIDWRRRSAALDVRVASEKADRLALAREFARDADPRVRVNALNAAPPNASDTAVRSLAVVALADADAHVRATALAILARRARAEDVTAALVAFERATKEGDRDSRLAALRLIAAAWTLDSLRLDTLQLRRLMAFSGAASMAEYRAVSSVSPMATWARSTPPITSRPLEDYQRLVRQWGTSGATQPRAVIRTERGDITIELFGADAPLVVEAFLRLTESGYYRNTLFHRVVPNFVAQDGAAYGDGSGGPGFSLRESLSRRRHERGAVGLATSGPDTGGSQYYLCHSTQPHLDGAYTVFGRIVDGFDVLDRLVQGDRMIRIERR